MRNTDEQLNEILKRSDRLKDIKTLRQRMIADIAGMLCTLLLLFGAAVCSPKVYDLAEGEMEVRYGSLILATDHMVIVIIGVLAFLLGILFTLFCIHLREYKKTKE